MHVERLDQIEEDPLEATFASEDLVAPSAPLPFVGGDGHAPAPVADELSELDEDYDPLNQTASITSLPALRALPFRSSPEDRQEPEASSQPGAPASSPGEPSATAPQQAEAPVSSPHGPASLSSQPAGGSSPGLSPHLEALGVEHYAAFCVEVRRHPEAAAEARKRYHIRDEAEHSALDQLWSRRMAADPQLLETWRWYVQSYEQWAVGHGQ